MNLYFRDGDFEHSFENGKLHVPSWRGSSEEQVMLDRCRDRLKPIASIILQPAWTEMQKDSAQQRGLVHRRFINAWGGEEMCASAVSCLTIRELLDARHDDHAVLLPSAIAAKVVHDYLWTAHGFDTSSAPTGRGLQVSLLETALLYGYPLARAIQDQRNSKTMAPQTVLKASRKVLKASRTGAFGDSLGGPPAYAAGELFGASPLADFGFGQAGAAKEEGLSPTVSGLFGAAAAAKKEETAPSAAATGENPALKKYTPPRKTHRKSRSKTIRKKVKDWLVTPKKLPLVGFEMSITSGHIEENAAAEQTNDPKMHRMSMETLFITPSRNISSVAMLQGIFDQMAQATVLGRWHSNAKLTYAELTRVARSEVIDELGQRWLAQKLNHTVMHDGNGSCGALAFKYASLRCSQRASDEVSDWAYTFGGPECGTSKPVARRDHGTLWLRLADNPEQALRSILDRVATSPTASTEHAMAHQHKRCCCIIFLRHW